MKKLTQAQTVVIKKHNIDSNNNNEMISINGPLVGNLIKLLKEVGAQEVKAIIMGLNGKCQPYKYGEMISIPVRDKKYSDVEFFIRPDDTGAFFSSEW